MQWRGSLAALSIAMGCVSKKEMTVDLNRLILGLIGQNVCLL